jgi:hypothetical protein
MIIGIVHGIILKEPNIQLLEKPSRTEYQTYLLPGKAYISAG